MIWMAGAIWAVWLAETLPQGLGAMSWTAAAMVGLEVLSAPAQHASAVLEWLAWVALEAAARRAVTAPWWLVVPAAAAAAAAWVTAPVVAEARAPATVV